MNQAVQERTARRAANDWQAIARGLGPAFAERAAAADRDGQFVAANYRSMREQRLFSAGIPAELGGGGGRYPELCAVIREIGRHCGSTALALSMHSHPVAVNVFKYRRGDKGAARILARIAGEELVIAGTGANDWLDSGGQSVRVDGGYRVSARKRFCSGAPGADILVTSVAHDREVLHFAIPFTSEGVRIEPTWDALGMRATGSDDVVLDHAFVTDEAIIGRRPAGVWHPMWDVILPSALPLIVAAYIGIAETAVEQATTIARRAGDALAGAVGEMHGHLATGRIAHDDMIRLNDDHGFTPSLALSDAVLTRKTVAADAVRRAVELAAELSGGSGYFRGHPVERSVRDIRAVHFHPLPARRQQVFSGRVALGLDPVTGT